MTPYSDPVTPMQALRVARIHLRAIARAWGAETATDDEIVVAVVELLRACTGPGEPSPVEQDGRDGELRRLLAEFYDETWAQARALTQVARTP